jgi:hypothetical protein
MRRAGGDRSSGEEHVDAEGVDDAGRLRAEEDAGDDAACSLVAGGSPGEGGGPRSSAGRGEAREPVVELGPFPRGAAELTEETCTGV